MTHPIAKLLFKTVCVSVIAGCLHTTEASAQVVVVYPPAAFIATSTPVYYEGRPAYWWGGFWYYRNGGVWGHYAVEPGFLASRRGGFAPAGRRYYEGRGGVRGGWARGQR